MFCSLLFLAYFTVKNIFFIDKGTENRVLFACNLSRVLCIISNSRVTQFEKYNSTLYNKNAM